MGDALTVADAEGLTTETGLSAAAGALVISSALIALDIEDVAVETAAAGATSATVIPTVSAIADAA